MRTIHTQLIRLLPRSVFVAASLPFAAQAGIIDDDGSGNFLLTPPGVNGANTVNADGPVFPNPNPSVTSPVGVNLSGDAGQTEVIDITGINYTVTNAGVLSGTNHHGINSTQVFTLNNTGSITGGTTAGQRGVLAPSATITNFATGSINGTDDAIHFTGNGGIVVNYGALRGFTGGVSDGIRGRDNLAVYNKNNSPSNGGSIIGVQYGIYAGANITVENEYQATITATNEDGIHLTGDGGLVLNRGTITALGLGNDDGIRGRTGLTVNNYNQLDSFGDPIAGGSIIGIGQHGVFADDTLTLENQSLATITGGVSGIYAGNGANIDNRGAIIGNTSGIRVADGALIINRSGGTITGAIGIDASGGPGSTFVLNNGGTVTGSGGTAVNGDLGVDTLNLGMGTVINGNLLLNSGADVVYMTANPAGSSIVNGNIDGGADADQLVFNGGKTSPSSTTNVVNGDVTNMVNIVKNGDGTAFIGDVGSFRTVETDSIRVNTGGLYINGNVDGDSLGQTEIGSAGRLGGTGTWDAKIDLVDFSSISPGQTALGIASNVADSVGTLTVTGDVTMGPFASYVWNATPGGPTDVIALAGPGNLFSTDLTYFNIAPTNVNRPLLNDSHIVVDTDDALIGTFDPNIRVSTFPATTPDNGPFRANQINPILAENFATLTKVDGGRDWQLTIAHDYSQFGRTPNEVAAGDMLDGLVNTATGDVADLLAALDYSNAATTEETLAALDPAAYLATASALATNNYHLHRTVENHNAAVRAGGGAVSMPAADPGAKGVVAAPVAIGCAGRSNVWGLFSYDWQDLSTGNAGLDQDGETATFAAGIDFTVADNFRLGLVAEGSQTEWDGNGSLGSDIDSYRIAAYANWGSATGWFVDALIGYNNNSVDQSRLVGMGNTFGIQSGSYDADGWQGMVNVGYTIDTAAGMFSPFLGVEAQQLEVDSFNGIGSPIPIAIGSFDIDSIRGLVGVKWGMEIAQSLRAYASLAYAAEFQGDGPSTSVGFGGGSFRGVGEDLGDSVLLSAGMLWNVANCTTLDFGYRGEFAIDNGLDSHGANVGINYSF